MVNCNFPIAVKRNGQHIIISFLPPVDIQSNITVKARKTVSSTTKFDAGIIVYREKLSQ